MKTQPLYYQNPYKTELECKALSVEQSTIFLNVILDQTIFYPEGGGQPSDRGMLGDAKVEYVRLMNGEIIHQIKGNVEKDQLIKGTLDWNWRYKYMKIHSAGHLLHDVLMTLTKKLTPIRGGYGKKAFLEYKGEMDLSLKDQIEQKVNQTAQTGIEIITKESSYNELSSSCEFLPPNLPKDKPLRIIKIGDFPPMPDGGIHVKNTKEIGKIWIANLTVQNGITNIRYGVVINH